MKWNIVTDSSCDLKQFAPEDERITFSKVPFVIRAADAEFIDDEHLSVEQMVAALSAIPEAGRTSCPSPETWLEKFQAEGNVIAVTISSNLSGSYNSACLARDMLLGTPKMVLKERSTGFDVWSFRGAIPECTMRELAKKAGVFIYQEESLPTYANSRMAAFFDHKGRKRKLRFPNKCSMTEYYSGEKYEYDGGELEIDFKENELKLFIIE